MSDEREEIGFAIRIYVSTTHLPSTGSFLESKVSYTSLAQVTGHVDPIRSSWCVFSFELFCLQVRCTFPAAHFFCTPKLFQKFHFFNSSQWNILCCADLNIGRKEGYKVCNAPVCVVFTLVGLQSRFEETLFWGWPVCPQSGTAPLEESNRRFYPASWAHSVFVLIVLIPYPINKEILLILIKQSSVCVLQIKPFLLPVDIQHNQCTYRFFNPIISNKRDTRFVVTKLRHRDTTLPRIYLVPGTWY